MKTYEKPRLFALSLSGNDRLCGDCAGKHTLYNDLPLAEQLITFFGIGNSPADKSDFDGVFGISEEQCASDPIIGYCKFTSTDTMVAWS